jgi:hypothetical protein
MLEEERKRAIKEALEFFGSVPPAKLERYLKATEDIPLEPLKEILSYMVDNNGKLYAPAQLKEKYKDWLKNNHQKIDWIHAEDCSDCGGRGLFEYEFYSAEMRGWYLTMAFCANCNSHNQPSAYKSQIENLIKSKPDKFKWHIKGTIDYERF